MYQTTVLGYSVVTETPYVGLRRALDHLNRGYLVFGPRLDDTRILISRLDTSGMAEVRCNRGVVIRVEVL